MCAFLLSWLFSCEVQVIEDRLPQPSVVSAFNGIWEVCFKEFIALEEDAYDGNFSFDNCIETFRAILEDLLSCVNVEVEFLVNNVSPMIISAFNGVSSYPAYSYGFCEVCQPIPYPFLHVWVGYT